jgi:hypothetical protein
MTLDPYKLLTPQERARINRALKKGPVLKRSALAEHTAKLYGKVTGRDLKATAEKVAS